MTLRDNYLILDDMAAIRSAGLRGFRATVAELGGNADEFAVLAGLPVAALDADDLLISDTNVAAVLEIAAERLHCPDLGLRIAARQDLGMLGPLALAIRTSPTLADALECTSRYLFVHARALSLRLEPDPYGDRGLIALHYGVPSPPPVQGTDLGLAFLHRAIQRLVEGPYALRSVDLPYRPPAPVEVYEQFFGAPVRFERPRAMLRVPRSLASHTLAAGDEKLRRLAVAFLAEQAGDAGASLVSQVSAAARQLLGTTTPEIAAVASLLTMHPRTLQRRLAAAGTSFATILDEVRRTEAHRYLTSTDLPLSQVASLIGLADQSTLTRCCRRWWHTTPSAIRRDHARARTA
ncbi:AraC family transcriptional regulator [Nocardia sp. NPDC003482]